MSTPRQREIGFENLSIATRWVVAGALGLAGLFTAAAAHALPGHTTAVPAGGTVSTPHGTSAGPGSPAGSNTLQPPTQPPAVSGSPPQVVSGGS